MDLYTVDPSTFSKNEVVEGWSSLIWTERYNLAGDITLVFSENSSVADLVAEGTFLHMPDSPDIMLVDTYLNDSGQITCTGQSLTGFLLNRIFRDTWSPAKDNFQITAQPGPALATIVSDMLLAGAHKMANGTVVPIAAGALEAFAKLTVGTGPAGTSVTIAVPYGTLYDAIVYIANLDALGFRLYPPSVSDGTGNLLFNIYRGLDRTTDQSTNEIVIFEPALDSLTNIKTLRSINGYKNVAYVFPAGATVQTQVGLVYAPGASGLSTWSRRTLMVDGSDINVADYTSGALASALQQKGVNALANNNYVRTTDGQIVPQSAFVYGTDYNLGDIVELRNTTNVAQQARITEYIRSEDKTGETAYPTLSVQ